MGIVPRPMYGYGVSIPSGHWEWREMDSTAAKVAGPIWSLVWILSWGRAGQPMRRWVEMGPPGICVPPTAQFSHVHPGNPPRGGSGVPTPPPKPKPTPLVRITMTDWTQ